MKKIFAMTAAALSLAACSTNDVADIISTDADNDIVNVASATRASTTTTDAMTLPFHLVNTTQKDKYGRDYEADFTHNGNAYAADKMVLWCNQKANGNRIDNVFQAFSPLYTSDNNASYTSFNLPTDQSSAQKLEAADWMTAATTSTKDNNDGNIDLAFNHKLAKIVLTVEHTNGDNPTPDIQRATVLGNTSAYAHGNIIEVIAKPQTIDAGTELVTLTTSDNETRTAKTLTELTLDEGKQYNFTVNMGHYAATISSVSVTDWTTADATEIDTPAKRIPFVTFSANEEQGFYITVNNYSITGMQYSVGNGEWTDIPSSGIASDEAVTFGGDKGNLRLRGKNLNGTSTSLSEYSYIAFTNGDVKVYCSGDIRTLLDYDNYKTVETGNARFCFLFRNCFQLVSAPALPATKLADFCYQNMFNNCIALTEAPELPATELASYCYFQMFSACTSLTKAPELPATELASYCYFQMFSACTSLTKAPELPATKLASSCYCEMFQGCNNLSYVTMLCDKFNNNFNLDSWLYNTAGAPTRTLTVKDREAYNLIESMLPQYWRINYATVKDENGNVLTD